MTSEKKIKELFDLMPDQATAPQLGKIWKRGSGDVYQYLRDMTEIGLVERMNIPKPLWRPEQTGNTARFMWRKI